MSILAAERTLAARTASLAVAVAALSGIASVPSGVAATPRWQHLESLDHGHGSALMTVAWASGRAWFVVGSQRGLAVASARVAGGRLAAQQTTQLQGPLAWYPMVVGTDAIYSPSPSTSGLARLQANGKVGATETPSPDPMASRVGAPVAAARVGGRIVWVLSGGTPVGEGLNFRPTLQVCCDEADAPRNLSQLATLRTQSPPRAHAIGVDRTGRVWLAWVDGRLGRAEIRMVELDPSTLAPRTQKALAAPVDRVAYPSIRTQVLPLVCTTTCRVVVSSYYDLPTGGGGTRIATWAPGERSATIVDLPQDPAGDYRHPLLVAAGSHDGKLTIAYRQESSANGRSLKVVRGDARGRNARLVGSVTLSERSRGMPIWSFFAGAFTPTAFVYGQSYSNYGLRGHVLATVVPLR